MPRISARCIASSLIAALAIGSVERVAVAGEPGPTMFQRAIGSWMGVVALLAEDDADEEAKEANDDRRDHGAHGRRGARGERGASEGRDRGPREWSRAGERGPGSSGRPPFMRRPPMGPGMGSMHAMPGMPMPGMRPSPSARLDEIVDRLTRIERKLDAAPRTGNPWSPRPEADRTGGERRPRAPMAAVPAEAQERVREMMQEGRRRMAEAQEKIEQARKKFQEMDERITKLEAEVERLKSSR